MTEQDAPSARLAGIKAVIFDMDGVVIDSEPLHERAQESIFASFGLDVPASEFVSFKGRAERDVFTDILARFGGEHHELETIVSAKHDAYQELLLDVKPVDGVLSFLRRVHGRFPLGLTTSAIAANQQFVFERLELDGLFDVVVTASDIVNTKPHPEPYLVTASRLDVSPEHVLVIEDSVLGIRSALAAGCTVVGLTGTFSRPVLEAERPHLVVDSFREMEELPLFRI